MNRWISKGLGVVVASIWMSLPGGMIFSGAQGTVDFARLEPAVLSALPREALATEVVQDEVLQTYTGSVAVMSVDSRNLLQETAVDCSMVKSVAVVQDNTFDRVVHRVELPAAQADFDMDGNLVQLTNYEDMSTVDKDRTEYDRTVPRPVVDYQLTEAADLTTIIENIEESCELDGYMLVTCDNSIEGVWNLTWHKDVGNGLLNPYDVAVATIDAKDGSLYLFTRNKREPNATTPLVTGAQARVLANPVINKLGADLPVETELTFFRPNYYWEEGGPFEPADFVRLAWKLTVDGSTFVYVDAHTGEILGGDRTQAVYARSVGPVYNFDGITRRVTLGLIGLQRLGYTHHLDMVDYTISQADIEYILCSSNLKALYLCCHGGTGVIADDTNGLENWKVYAEDIPGGWNFVYLDACLSSKTADFPEAFIDPAGSGQCFVGWNNSIMKLTAYQFTVAFWPRVNYISILDAVLKSRADTLAAGYSDCNPGFWGDTNYWGRA